MLELLIAAAALLPCDPDVGPLIVAHRGGTDSGQPENTLPAFQHAVNAGAQVIELDLRATRDGQVVVLHDARVDRTTDGHGPVRDFELAALKRLDTGGGVRIPTLAEVLDGTRTLNVDLLLDVKPAPGLRHVDIARAVIDRHDPARVIFGVRSLSDRAALSDAAPGLRFLGFVPGTDEIDDFLAAGVEAIRLWPGWLHRDPTLIERVHRAGASVWVTAGDASVASLAALADLGVDALLTDHPGAAARLGCR